MRSRRSVRAWRISTLIPIPDGLPQARGVSLNEAKLAGRPVLVQAEHPDLPPCRRLIAIGLIAR